MTPDVETLAIADKLLAVVRDHLRRNLIRRKVIFTVWLLCCAVTTGLVATDLGDGALAFAMLVAGYAVGWWDSRTYTTGMLLYALDETAGERR